jgi:VWFA-related protein
MSRSSCRRSVLCLCGGLLAASLALSQAPPAPDPAVEPFGERIDVRAVNVETTVTDRQGRRVTGLKAEDFELRVDGRPVPLDFFLEVRDRRAIVPEAVAGQPQPALPAEVGAGERVPHSYLVFVDELISPITLRKAALRRLSGELDRLGPGDRMAVVAAGESGLVVLCPWSRSKERLAAALAAAGKRTGHLQPFAPEAVGLAGDQVAMVGKIALEDLRMATFQRMIAAAAQAQRMFAAAPGRKVLLLISGRWEGARHEVDRRRGFGLVRPLTDASNRLGYTVYPVQLEAAIDVLPGAEVPGLLGAGEVIRSKELNGFMRDQQTMAFTAEETGGRLLTLAQGFLGKATDDLASYYWLGFSTDATGSGRRTIEVRVHGKQKLKVRTRSSYLPLSGR